jgi:peptidyl-prolyl cis-trans isomerase C
MIGLFLLLAGLPALLQAQVLAKVGEGVVTSEQLERAISSSPFAQQFPSLDEREQSRLRIDFLNRLVGFELLYQEARRLKLEQSATFQHELKAFERSLLAKAYLERLRDQIKVPQAKLQAWRQQYRQEPDALAAARAQFVAHYYQKRKEQELAKFKTRFGNLDETEVWARAARRAKLDVSRQLAGYRRERLVQLLLERKEKEWIPSEKVLQSYYLHHPEIGLIPERRHIAQIVVASRELAERLRARVIEGESLFRLAGDYSIDPYGRERAGDMGWLPAGSGMAEIEAVLANLADGEISPVIATPRGFHLVMIVERKPAEQKPFESVSDRVRRALLAEKLPKYLESLAKRYPVRFSDSPLATVAR